MKVIKGFLVIRNGDEIRWRTRASDLLPNEVAIAVTVKMPMPPRVVASIEIELPEPPPAEASAEVAGYGS